MRPEVHLAVKSPLASRRCNGQIMRLIMLEVFTSTEPTAQILQMDLPAILLLLPGRSLPLLQKKVLNCSHNGESSCRIWPPFCVLADWNCIHYSTLFMRSQRLQQGEGTGWPKRPMSNFHPNSE